MYRPAVILEQEYDQDHHAQPFMKNIRKCPFRYVLNRVQPLTFIFSVDFLSTNLATDRQAHREIGL